MGRPSKKPGVYMTTEGRIVRALERIAAALEAASPEKQLAATLKLMPEAMQVVSRAVAREHDKKLVRETAGLPGLGKQPSKAARAPRQRRALPRSKPREF